MTSLAATALCFMTLGAEAQDLAPPAPAPAPETGGPKVEGSASSGLAPAPAPAPLSNTASQRKWRVVVLRNEIMLAAPPYLLSYDYSIQPTFVSCQDQCQNTPGCLFGTYFTADVKKGQCWLSAHASSTEKSCEGPCNSFEIATISKTARTPGETLMKKNEQLRDQMVAVLAEQKQLVETIHQLKLTQQVHKSEIENKVDNEVQQELNKIIHNHADTLDTLSRRQAKVETFLSNSSGFVAGHHTSHGILHPSTVSITTHAKLSIIHPMMTSSCETPAIPTNGYISRWTSNHPGGIVAFACDYKHYLSGSEIQTCLNDMTWSGHTPQCKEHSNATFGLSKTGDKCSDPPVPQNGFVQQWNYDKVGGEVTIKCHPGFKPVGSTVRTCLADMTWSGQTTFCVEKSAFTKAPTPSPFTMIGAPPMFEVPTSTNGCGDLKVLYDENIQKGLYLWGNSSSVGGVIKFRCWGTDSEGKPYRMIGPSMAVCKKDLTWTNFPTCMSEAKKCSHVFCRFTHENDEPWLRKHYRMVVFHHGKEKHGDQHRCVSEDHGKTCECECWHTRLRQPECVGKQHIQTITDFNNHGTRSGCNIVGDRIAEYQDSDCVWESKEIDIAANFYSHVDAKFDARELGEQTDLDYIKLSIKFRGPQGDWTDWRLMSKQKNDIGEKWRTFDADESPAGSAVSFKMQVQIVNGDWKFHEFDNLRLDGICAGAPVCEGKEVIKQISNFGSTGTNSGCNIVGSKIAEYQNDPCIWLSDEISIVQHKYSHVDASFDARELGELADEDYLQLLVRSRNSHGQWGEWASMAMLKNDIGDQWRTFDAEQSSVGPAVGVQFQVKITNGDFRFHEFDNLRITGICAAATPASPSVGM